MSKQKLNSEEKKHRFLQFFHEKKEFYQLNDLEKLVPKEKGITANTIKTTLMSLVDDGLVEQEKIGSSTYYWSFPSKIFNIKKRKLEELEMNLDTSQKKLKIINGNVNEAEEDKENLEEIQQINQEINYLKETKEKIVKELKILQENDQEFIKKVQTEIEVIKKACNRWTDNIFSIKSYCKKKFSMEENLLNRQFRIPEDLDYLD